MRWIGRPFRSLILVEAPAPLSRLRPSVGGRRQGRVGCGHGKAGVTLDAVRTTPCRAILRLRKPDRTDGFCERCEIARRCLGRTWRHGLQTVLGTFLRGLHVLKHDARDELKERRLPDAS